MLSYFQFTVAVLCHVVATDFANQQKLSRNERALAAAIEEKGCEVFAYLFFTCLMRLFQYFVIFKAFVICFYRVF